MPWTGIPTSGSPDVTPGVTGRVGNQDGVGAQAWEGRLSRDRCTKASPAGTEGLQHLPGATQHSGWDRAAGTRRSPPGAPSGLRPWAERAAEEPSLGVPGPDTGVCLRDCHDLRLSLHSPWVLVPRSGGLVRTVTLMTLVIASEMCRETVGPHAGCRPLRQVGARAWWPWQVGRSLRAVSLGAGALWLPLGVWQTL